jgi:hypothetical protein
MPGGGGSSQPQTVTQTTNSTPWGEAIPYLKQGMQEAQRLYEDPTRPSYYPGQTFANPSSATMQGLGGTEARALAGSPTLAAAQNEAGYSLGGNYLSAGNPYFSAMADRVRANVLPQIDSRFITANRGGSALHGRAVGQGLADAMGALAYQNYSDERNRMGQYAGMAPQLAQADYLDPSMLAMVGAQRESIAQKPIDEAIGRWQYDQNLPYAKLSDYMSVVKGVPGGTSNTVGQQFLPQQNSTMQGLGTALGGVAALAPYAAMIFSDERLKTDIQPVGETYSGTPIYRWRYKWGGAPMFGPMAQDVLEKQPEAVGLADYMGKSYLTIDPTKVK